MKLSNLPPGVTDRMIEEQAGAFDEPTWKPLKTIRSHSGYARFLAECDDDDVGNIERIAEIPSPYHFSSHWPVWRWNGRLIFVRETSHKVYKVYAVPADMRIWDTAEIDA